MIGYKTNHKKNKGPNQSEQIKKIHPMPLPMEVLIKIKNNNNRILWDTEKKLKEGSIINEIEIS